MPDHLVDQPVLDSDTVEALREILDDPALPVGTTAALAGGDRASKLREAHDFLSTHRIAATAARSRAAAVDLLAALGEVDPALAASLRGHTVLAPVLTGLPPTRARNALLGNIHRGELITWVPAVESWTWFDAVVPADDAPIGRVDAVFETGELPSLYNHLVLWEPVAAALVVVPTHRDRIDWEAVGPDGSRWRVRLSRAVFHVNDLIPLDTDPTALPDRPESAETT
ncbi:hypothetical protein ACFVVM_08825 [Nocardia sp. NPDC058176]|uniref:hypothetical protein n=1 Tax=Nocardia sp. NPDC058176 TaxID=3346368 RepID=UPI0036D7B0D2